MKCANDHRVHYCDGRDRRICAMDFWTFGFCAFVAGTLVGTLSAMYLMKEVVGGRQDVKPALELPSCQVHGEAEQ